MMILMVFVLLLVVLLNQNKGSFRPQLAFFAVAANSLSPVLSIPSPLHLIVIILSSR